MFEEKERSHAEMAKRLDKCEATSTRAAKNMSENQKIIQEQGNLMKKNKRKVALMDQVLKIRKLWKLKKI